MKILYYPYSRCYDELTLKKMLLLFEKIYFVDSKPPVVRELINENFLADKNNSDINNIYKLAQRANLIEYIDVRNMLNDYDSLLCANIFNDLHDNVYIDTSIKYSTESFSVLAERLPKSFTSFFRGAGFSFEEEIVLQKIIKNDGDISRLNESDLKVALHPSMLHNHLHYITYQNAIKVFKEKFADTIGGNPVIKLSSYELSFTHLASLRINEAILLSALNDLAMVTDESVFDTLLKIKQDRTIKYINEKTEIENKNLFKYNNNSLKKRVAVELFSDILDDIELRQIPIKDIIKFRLANRRAFELLWSKINDLSLELSVSCNDEEIFRIVYEKYMKDIAVIKSSMKKTIESSFKSLLLNSAKAIIPTAVTSIALGLSNKLILGACATAEIGYLSSSGVNDISEVITKLNTSCNNPYAFLLGIKESKKMPKKKIKNCKYEGYIEIGLLNDIPLCLVSFIKATRVFYLIYDITLSMMNIRNEADIEKICKKRTIIKRFEAEDLQSAINHIKKELPDFIIDEHRISKSTQIPFR